MRSNGGEGTLKERERTIYFATGNKGKWNEATEVAAEFGVRLKRVRGVKLEIQSDDLREIASFAAGEACKTILHPVVAEDSGFFVHALGGFPGPYSSYVYRTLGCEGILRLLHSEHNRDAAFQATVAFCKPKSRPVYFTGIVNGTVSRDQRGNHGFGFDPIFIPKEGDGRTFAEMSTRQKNMYSHRARAFTSFFNWLTIARNVG
jgi:XTP/dITP diphosphohydrolase